MQLAWLESVSLFSVNFVLRTRYRCALATLVSFAPLSAALAGTLYIGGTPKTTIAAPGAYHFHPWIAGSERVGAKWTIKNKPSWAGFNPTTGNLSGRVTGSTVGTYKNIQISAAGGGITARMPAFSIVVTAGTGGP